jgi:hypothetical protein
MWNVCYSAGMLIGPVLCSSLSSSLGFAGMLEIVGLGVAAWGLVVAGVFAMLPRRTEEEVEEEKGRDEERRGVGEGEKTPLLGD